MENIKVAKGGMSIQEKRFRWEIQNFSTIVKNEEFLTKQKLEFEIIDSNGVRSAWRANLSWSPLPLSDSSSTSGTETTKKGKSIDLEINLIEKDGCCSELFAQVSPKLEDAFGNTLFIGFTPEQLGVKYTTKQVRYWKICEISPKGEFDRPNFPCRTLTIDITVKLTTLLNEPSLGVDAEAICANRKQQLYQNIGMLVNDQKHSDIKIVSGDGQEFFAYRWILSGASEVFEAMFRSDMQENKTGILEIGDVSGNTLKLLLNFIYTGKVGDEWSQPGIVEELIYASEKYQLQDLKDFLDGSLGKICTVENAGNLLALAKKTSMEKAVGDIMSFIIRE